ncbi:GGDEF domain-containing protein [Bacillus canaveralius]|uniref:GGDEF domain-containing protein n=1 Tax=Bacillus canaveralius TaxID=1403243 RepID=A0A2N5GQT2_9BACI|nr:GGDEF and EAL domain-containing protein [Bacillus canaveralius]PLR85566.1 GGDEF domain-containing protein [Bacillus canaveralius]PLR94773.1 GGDEF domain-containing protein [Bacillus canaveralius]
MGNLHKHRVMIAVGFFILAVILHEIGALLFVSNGVSEYIIDLAIISVIVIMISFMFKETDETAEELQKNRQRLNNIFDTLDVAIWSHDLKSDILLITPGIEKLYGYSLDEFYQDHTLWKRVIHPEDVNILAEREQSFLRGEPITNVYRIIRSDGEVRWIQDRGIPTVDENGNLSDFNSVLFDITDRKESEDRYRSLVEMSPDIIAVYSRGQIDYINEAGSKLFGAASQQELIGQPIWKLVAPAILEQIKHRELTLDENFDEKMTFEFQARRLDDKRIDVEITAMPIFYEGRTAKQIVGRDISQRKQAEKTIQYMAYYDGLTGLPNRNMFKKHLNEVLNERKNQMLAVLFLDLDRFKIINDTKGHAVGDLLLKLVAKRLGLAVQNDGVVSRQGGDEFIILLEDTDKEKAVNVAQRMLDEFSHSFEINSQEIFVTTSIGISIYPVDGEDEETLLKNADTAMYLAKERGKNNFQFYTDQLHLLSSRKLELENGLRKALEQEQLVLYYQPQVELKTGKIVGVESLIRWQHSDHGFISPDEFIPLAEETGLIVPLGKWVLRKACEQNKKWQQQGYKAIPIAVNISVRQLQDDDFVELVKKVLNETGLDPRYLELEITESIMQNIDRSENILNQLKDLGIKISIDDFGTGYSSLSYLKHLPIDGIKIDKSFVDDIINHSNQGAMVKTMIDMGHNLNFTVIAEGIENQEQVAFLKKNACKIGQGYYYSKPLAPDEMEKLLTNDDAPKSIPIK